jgi:hypothetical protein
MSPVDIALALRRRPFEPFRIQVSDGTTYEVRYPELVMIGLGSVLVGVPAAGQTLPIYERCESVSLADIVKLIPMPAPTGSNTNGQQP